MSENLQREPNDQEKMYLEIMQKMDSFLSQCVEQYDLDDKQKSLVKLKGALFSSASLIFQFYHESKLSEEELDELLTQCKEWLVGGVKGIKQGAEFMQRS